MRNRSRALGIGLAAVLGGILCAGCSSTDRYFMTSGPRLNMCRSDQPQAVGIRIFYLKGTTAFQNAEPQDLWDDPRKVLGDEYVAHVPYTVNPLQEVALEIPVSRTDEMKAATHIAVAALFCQPGPGRCWQETVPITKRNQQILVHLSQNCLRLQ